MIPILWRASLRDLSRHRWQTALSILGIALGVVMVIAVDIANESARRAFELSVERVAGRATHQIESATGHLTDQQFAALAPHLAALDASPVIEAAVRIDSATFTLLGLDPLALARLNSMGARAAGLSLGELMVEPGALLLGHADAERLDARPGDALRLTADGTERPAHLAGVIADQGGRDGGNGRARAGRHRPPRSSPAGSAGSTGSTWSCALGRPKSSPGSCLRVCAWCLPPSAVNPCVG